MFTRTGLLGLVGVLALAGVAGAESPLPPHGEGRDPAPLARASFAADAPARHRRAADAAALAGFVTGVRDAVLNRLTVPLGAAAVGD